MKKKLKVILVLLGSVAVGIQLIPVERTNPKVLSDFTGSPEVKAILQRSCYDCHSNETKWPWYSYVAPVSWWVAHDVEEGREELNFSDWDRFEKDAEIKEEIYEEVSEKEMPLFGYLITHPKAAISDKEMAQLQAWAGVSLGSGHRKEGDDD